MDILELQILKGELERIYERFSEPGQPCDECLSPRVEGECRYIITLPLPFGHLLYSLCPRCAVTGFPNIRKETERISERLVSDGVAPLVEAGRMSAVLN